TRSAGSASPGSTPPTSRRGWTGSRSGPGRSRRERVGPPGGRRGRARRRRGRDGRRPDPVGRAGDLLRRRLVPRALRDGPPPRGDLADVPVVAGVVPARPVHRLQPPVPRAAGSVHARERAGRRAGGGGGRRGGGDGGALGRSARSARAVS